MIATAQCAPRTSSPLRDPFRITWWELTGLLLLIGSYLVAEQGGETFIPMANAAGPACLLVMLALGAIRLARANPDCMWTSLFWFRVSAGVFFGFGGLVPALANDATLTYMKDYFAFDSMHAVKFNLMIAIGCLIVLLSGSLAAALMKPIRGSAARHLDDRQLLAMGLIFGAVGYTVKFAVVLPTTVGAIGDAVVPATVLTLGQLSPVSLYLLTRWVMANKVSLLPLVVAALLADMAIGMLQFNKTELLLSLVMFMLAYLGQAATLRRIIISAAVLVIVLTTIAPINDFGRQQIFDRHSSLVGAGFGERFEAIRNYFDEPAPTRMGEEVQALYYRLSYVYTGALAIDLHDRGYTGASLDDTFTALVPRFVWPDKPILSDVGRQFNVIATGNPNSWTAPGFFAEAYWNFGWLGLPLVFIPIGALLGATSQFALRIMDEGRWIQFPVAMLAMRLGFRVDGWIVIDFVGPTILMAVSYLALAATEQAIGTHSGLQLRRLRPRASRPV